MTNVIVFISDEHNPFFSSVYGHPFVQTPNMERLAQRGTVYENAYCPTPLCIPSRSAFMTGYWPHEIQRYNNSKVIEARYPSYGGVLAGQGIHTAHIGSGSSLYRDPEDLGFTDMLAVPDAGPSVRTNPIREGAPVERAPKLHARHGRRKHRYAEDAAFVDRAVDWLQETAPSLTVPWTVTVNVRPPHPPWTADPAYFAMYEGHGDLPRWGSEQPSAQHPYARDLRAHRGWDYSHKLIRALRQGYYAAVSYVDHELGRVLDAATEAGLADDTVICYTTDHGEMLGKFGIWGKRSLYEDSVRVPIIAAGPGFTPATRVTTPASTLDLQAALFHAVGAQRPSGWHGEALQTLAEHDPSRTVFSEYHGPGVRAGAYMVRRGDWKLLYNVDAGHQLFHLADDPDELNDQYASQPDRAAELEAELRRICDPEAVHQDARDFQDRQLRTIASLQERLGTETTEIGWESDTDESRCPD